ncbi:MAG: hypothetical protein EXR62_10275 [Chloroflexi bacterium]|nr:hypothetical protein [Chloroflexota bacterium]
MDQNNNQAIAPDLQDRLLGLLLGMAVGDALGAPVEGWQAEEIAAKFGQVQGYVDTGFLSGCYTHHGQQALCVMEVLLAKGQFDGAALRDLFVELAQIHIPGGYRPKLGRSLGVFRGARPAFREAVEQMAAGVAWEKAGIVSAANDAVARVLPLAIIHRENKLVAFREDVINAVWMTHRDPRALSVSVAFSAALLIVANHGARMGIEEFFNELRVFIENGEDYIEKRYWSPEVGLPRQVCRQMSLALRVVRSTYSKNLAHGLQTITAFARSCSSMQPHALSPFVIATFPTALLLFAHYHDDPTTALLQTVNLGGESAALGAIVGALIGGRHGAAELPRDWLAGLRHADFMRQRAEALIYGKALPADAPTLREVEVKLTLDAGKYQKLAKDERYQYE